MENFIRIESGRLGLALSILGAAGITSERINLYEEIAKADAEDYFDNHQDEIHELHEECFHVMDYEEFEPLLKAEVLRQLLSGKSDYFKGVEGVRSLIDELVDEEIFLIEYRTGADGNPL